MARTRRLLACLTVIMGMGLAAHAAQPDLSGAYVFTDGNAIGRITLDKQPETGRYRMRITFRISQPKEAHGEYHGYMTVTDGRATFHSRGTPDCVLKFVFNGERVAVSGDTPTSCIEAKGFSFTHTYRKKFRG